MSHLYAAEAETKTAINANAIQPKVPLNILLSFLEPPILGTPPPSLSGFSPLPNDIFRADQYRLRNLDVQLFGDIEVHDELELPGLLDWQVSWFSSLQNPRYVGPAPPEHIRPVDRIAHHRASFR